MYSIIEQFPLWVPMVVAFEITNGETEKKKTWKKKVQFNLSSRDLTTVAPRTAHTVHNEYYLFHIYLHICLLFTLYILALVFFSSLNRVRRGNCLVHFVWISLKAILTYTHCNLIIFIISKRLFCLVLFRFIFFFSRKTRNEETNGKPAHFTHLHNNNVRWIRTQCAIITRRHARMLSAYSCGSIEI